MYVYIYIYIYIYYNTVILISITLSFINDTISYTTYNNNNVFIESSIYTIYI